MQCQTVTCVHVCMYDTFHLRLPPVSCVPVKLFLNNKRRLSSSQPCVLTINCIIHVCMHCFFEVKYMIVDQSKLNLLLELVGTSSHVWHLVPTHLLHIHILSVLDMRGTPDDLLHQQALETLVYTSPITKIWCKHGARSGTTDSTALGFTIIVILRACSHTFGLLL